MEYYSSLHSPKGQSMNLDLVEEQELENLAYGVMEITVKTTGEIKATSNNFVIQKEKLLHLLFPWTPISVSHSQKSDRMHGIACDAILLFFSFTVNVVELL
ncbi:hypothetical protein SLE2022_206600 [Rubroshorea leprosula]